VSKIKKCNFKTITEMAFHRKRRRNTLGRNWRRYCSRKFIRI